MTCPTKLKMKKKKKVIGMLTKGQSKRDKNVNSNINHSYKNKYLKKEPPKFNSGNVSLSLTSTYIKGSECVFAEETRARLHCPGKGSHFRVAPRIKHRRRTGALAAARRGNTRRYRLDIDGGG